METIPTYLLCTLVHIDNILEGRIYVVLFKNARVRFSGLRRDAVQFCVRNSFWCLRTDRVCFNGIEVEIFKLFEMT